MRHSLFVVHFNENGESTARTEEHDLTNKVAMQRSMDNLYRKGKLVGGVKVEVRNKNGIAFSATNPLPSDKFLYPKIKTKTKKCKIKA